MPSSLLVSVGIYERSSYQLVIINASANSFEPLIVFASIIGVYLFIVVVVVEAFGLLDVGETRVNEARFFFL